MALGLALLALVIAVLAALGAGYLWYRGQQRLADLNNEINSATGNVRNSLQQELRPKVSQLNKQVSQLSNNLGQVRNTLQSREQKLASLSQTIAQVQSQDQQLQQALGGDHEKFVEQRILALLEAANQRIEVYHDPQGAIQALQMADQAIAHAGYPQLHPVREDIAQELTALRGLPQPDIDGLALQLSQLANRVPKLPTSTSVPSTYHNGNTGKAAKSDRGNKGGGANGGGFAGVDWQQHWNRLIDTLSGALTHMATVRSANGTQNAPALMAPDQAFFLVENLQLEFRMARMALLEHNGKVYHASLSEAHDWIKQYFDTSDSATQAVLSSIAKLSKVQLDASIPDISASLTSMRRISGLSSGSTGSSSGASGNPNSSSPGNGGSSSGGGSNDNAGQAGGSSGGGQSNGAGAGSGGSGSASQSAQGGA